MNVFVWNMILALCWTLLTNQWSLRNLFFGYVLGLLVLMASRRVFARTKYFTKIKIALFFLLSFSAELINTSMRVAHDVLTPRFRMKPGVVAIPLDLKSDFAITVFANLLSLTPGTLSLGVSAKKDILYVHAMYIDNEDIEAFRKNLKTGLEQRVKELLE